MRATHHTTLLFLLVAGCSGGGSTGGESPDLGGAPDLAPAAPNACGSGPAKADERLLPADVLAVAPDLELRAGTDRLEVWARRGSALSAADLSAFQARSCEALRFDLAELAVPADAMALRPAIRVVVLDGPAYDDATGAPGTYGVAYVEDGAHGDALVVPEESLSDLMDLDDTLAHEITHVVVGRLAPYDLEIPLYFLEGMAISMGARFEKRVHGRVTGFSRPWILAATGDSARLTVQRYDLEDRTRDLREVGHDQSIGGFFVEYLRAKSPRGGARGFPDVQPLLLAAMVAASDGAAFDDSFAARFALPLADAKGAYAQFLDDTRGDRAARLSGTIFE